MENEYVDYPEDFDFGYDPTQTEPIEFAALIETDLPDSVQLNSSFLPPIGSQGQCPSCVAWASVYGLVTYWMASNNNVDPTSDENQASPSYIYIKVMQGKKEPVNQCEGSSFLNYFPILKGDGGTPNLANAPYTDSPNMGSGECTYLWQNYQNGTPQVDPRFNVTQYAALNTKKIKQIKQALYEGYAIAYGTKLYTDFSTYRGNNLPVPYVGNGILKYGKTGALAGHCMLIIGYDNNCGPNGAFLIQNSWTTSWGQNGLVWMDCNTFVTLAQGQGFYLPNA